MPLSNKEFSQLHSQLVGFLTITLQDEMAPKLSQLLARLIDLAVTEPTKVDPIVQTKIRPSLR